MSLVESVCHWCWCRVCVIGVGVECVIGVCVSVCHWCWCRVCVPLVLV